MPIAEIVALAKEVGFGRAASVVEALAALPGSPETVAEELRSQHLLGFVQRALREADAHDRVPASLRDALASRRPIQRATPRTLLATFADVRRTLESAGISTLMLKGLIFAERLHGGIDRRPQFDVDVLVRRRELRRASAVLARTGFAPEAYDLHSRTLIRDGIKVDVHGALRWAPAYRLEEDTIWAARREVPIDGTLVPTLSDEHALLLLLLATVEDLGQGTSNLKQLLDLALLARELEPTTDWREFFARRGRENLLEVSVNALAVVVDAFELRAALPRLAAELASHADLVRHADRRHALALLGAAPKSAASLRWFMRVYPGSIVLWVAWFWASGFPANLRRFDRAWLSQSLGMVAEWWRARRRR